MTSQRIDHLLTAEQAFWLDPCERWELVGGRIVELSPVKRRHGRILARLARSMVETVEEQGLGEVYVGDVGFVLRRNPDTVRAPDLAFVRKARLPSEPEEAFSDTVPDLVVEILSPSDRWHDVEHKVAEFLAAGVVVVWILDPQKNRAHVYRAGLPARVLTESDSIEAPDLVPSLRLRIGELLA